MAAAGWVQVSFNRFRPQVKAIEKRLNADTFKAVNLAAQVVAELLRAATPRLTGKTARSIRVKKTERYDLKAVAGFFPGKGNTAFVARILEVGRKPSLGGRLILSRGRDAQGNRIMRRKRGASAMAPRPILAKVMPLVPTVIRESFKRVFGPDWRPRPAK